MPLGGKKKEKEHLLKESIFILRLFKKIINEMFILFLRIVQAMLN